MHFGVAMRVCSACSTLVTRWIQISGENVAQLPYHLRYRGPDFRQVRQR